MFGPIVLAHIDPVPITVCVYNKIDVKEKEAVFKMIK